MAEGGVGQRWGGQSGWFRQRDGQGSEGGCGFGALGRGGQVAVELWVEGAGGKRGQRGPQVGRGWGGQRWCEQSGWFGQSDGLGRGGLRVKGFGVLSRGVGWRRSCGYRELVGREGQWAKGAGGQRGRWVEKAI